MATKEFKADSTAPDRADIKNDIIMCNDFVEGETKVKSKGKTYLWPFSPSMSIDAYNLYKKEAHLTGYTSAFHQSVVGALLRRAPTITLPEKYDWIHKSFGDRSQGLLLWMSEVLANQVITSNDWIMVDYPVVVGKMSDAEKEAKGIRPYPVRIPAVNILEARTAQKGSKQELLEFRFMVAENSSDEESTHTTIKRVIGLYIDPSDGFAYRQDYLDNKPDGSPIQFIVANKPLTHLPVFSLNGQITPMKPLLLDIAQLDEKGYNQQSRSDHYSLLMGTSTVWTTGLPNEDRANVGGLGGIWHGPEVAKFGTLGIDPSVVEAYDKKLSEYGRKASAFGAKMFSDLGRQAESAEALTIKNASVHATLGHLSSVFSRVIEQILTFTILWDTGEDVSDEISIELSKDFVPQALNGTDLTALVAARMQGVITESIFFHVLNRGEMVPDGMTLSTFQEDLQNQISTEQPL